MSISSALPSLASCEPTDFVHRYHCAMTSARTELDQVFSPPPPPLLPLPTVAIAPPPKRARKRAPKRVTGDVCDDEEPDGNDSEDEREFKKLRNDGFIVDHDADAGGDNAAAMDSDEEFFQSFSKSHRTHSRGGGNNTMRGIGSFFETLAMDLFLRGKYLVRGQFVEPSKWFFLTTLEPYRRSISWEANALRKNAVRTEGLYTSFIKRHRHFFASITGKLADIEWWHEHGVGVFGRGVAWWIAASTIADYVGGADVVRLTVRYENVVGARTEDDAAVTTTIDVPRKLFVDRRALFDALVNLCHIDSFVRRHTFAAYTTAAASSLFDECATLDDLFDEVFAANKKLFLYPFCRAYDEHYRTLETAPRVQDDDVDDDVADELAVAVNEVHRQHVE